jgi:hypothetical protein
MGKPNVVVLSHAHNVPFGWAVECIESVARQTVPVHHIYTLNDAAPALYRIREYVHAVPASVALHIIGGNNWFVEVGYDIIHALRPETIVVCVSGDDFLLTDQAIERVLREYDAGALATYGQFYPVPAGPCGSWRASEYSPAVVAAGSYRQDQWRAAHLETFRAGLYQRIKREDLLDGNGRWNQYSGDQATMLPILEMARERAHFIPDELYAYRTGNPLSVHNVRTPERHAEEVAEVAHVRALPCYARI